MLPIIGVSTPPHHGEQLRWFELKDISISIPLMTSWSTETQAVD
jgi:hypothetical protein